FRSSKLGWQQQKDSAGGEERGHQENSGVCDVAASDHHQSGRHCQGRKKIKQNGVQDAHWPPAVRERGSTDEMMDSQIAVAKVATAARIVVSPLGSPVYWGPI